MRMTEMKDNSYKFICNRDCEYFPCHETDCPEKFNCLFCYCPLYALGEECGGNFTYTENGIKDCSSCMVPHSENAYEHIMAKSRALIELVRKK